MPICTQQIGYSRNNFNSSTNCPIEQIYKLGLFKLNTDVVSFKGKDCLPINLRRATLKDTSFILKLEKLCFPGNKKWYACAVDFLKKSIRKDLSHMMVLDRKGNIVGHFHTKLYEKRNVCLYTVAVHPDARGKRVGHQIMHAVFNQAANVKAKKIGLMVQEDNEVAQKLYKKFGFKFKQKVNNYYEKGKHALLMEVNLTNPKTKERLEKLRQEVPSPELPIA